jgi:putative ABC transport system permease protein
MSGWRPALRIARRELLRAKGRTALVLFMVLLPVTAVVCLSTLLRTNDISPVESLPRELGAASARLEHTGSQMEQHPDSQPSSGFGNVPVPDAGAAAGGAARRQRLLEVRTSYADERIEVGDRRRRVALVAVDLRKPELTGPFRVLSGRAPAGVDEVAVTEELADLGVEVGRSIELEVGRRTVTGVVQQPYSMYRSRAVLGLDDAVGLPGPTGGRAGPPCTTGSPGRRSSGPTCGGSTRWASWCCPGPWCSTRRRTTRCRRASARAATPR